MKIGQRVASTEGVKTHVGDKENNENNLPKKIIFPPQCKDYSKDNFNTPWKNVYQQLYLEEGALDAVYHLIQI